MALQLLSSSDEKQVDCYVLPLPRLLSSPAAK